ncbi:formin-like protein 2 isoform X2 [Oscarella lobularis]|uniref:formin-like protein 2 isoform X2 n=1 Tax=Oscarella lobularis TaxID=121494 RepID=UPI00331368A7
MGNASSYEASAVEQERWGESGLGRPEMPSKEEVDKRFTTILETMNLPADKATAMAEYSYEKKWTLVCDQERAKPTRPPEEYIRKISEILTIGEGKVNRRSVAALNESVAVLRALEISLRTNEISWVQAFLSDEKAGLEALVEYLSLVLKLPSMQDGNKKLRRISKSKRSAGGFTDDVHVCILCLRALMNNKYGFQAVMEHSSSINYIALCLDHPNYRTKSLVCDLLAALCRFKGGHDKVISAMDNFRNVQREVRRFKTLADSLLHSQGQVVNMEYRAAGIGLVNAIVYTPEDLNYCVHLQYEFTQLGWDHWLQSIRPEVPVHVLRQISAYEDNYFDVESLSEEANAKASALGRVEELEAQVQEVTEKCQHLENEAMRQTAEQQKVIAELRKELEQVKKLAAAATTSNKSDETMEKKSAEKKNDDDGNPDDVDVPVEPSSTEQKDAVPTPPPPPAPAPPPPPPPSVPGAPAPPPPPGTSSSLTGGLGSVRKKRQVQTKYRMPLFNWQSLQENKIKGTIFGDIDDEKLYDMLNFDQFEEEFKTKAQPNFTTAKKTAKDDKDSGVGGGKSESSLKKNVDKKPEKDQALLDPSRARNLGITLKRIGLSADVTVSAINDLDLSVLPVEYVELLLKLVPTDSEVKLFERYVADGKPLKKLNETDFFMYKLTQVERLLPKLKILAYIGNFFDNIHMLIPQLDAIIAASNSLLNSQKLKKLIEIVLAFGNYMNSSKRGGVYGFRLQSLDLLNELRSTDRKTTLLEHLVLVVKEHFSDVAGFVKELQFLDKAATASLDAVIADVRELTRNVQVAKAEKERQPMNTVLNDFLANAEPKLIELKESVETAETVFKAAVEYFGESTTTATPNAFFSLFNRFVRDYKRAELKVEQRRQIEILAAEAKGNETPNQLAAPRAFDRSKRKSRVVLLTVKDGALDEAISGMKEEGYRVGAELTPRQQRKRATTMARRLTMKSKSPSPPPTEPSPAAAAASANRRAKPVDPYLASRPWLK